MGKPLPLARLPSAIKVFFVVDLLFGALYLAGIALSGSRLTWLWDLNIERALPTWYSSMQLALVGVLLLGLLAALALALVDGAASRPSAGQAG